MNAILEARKLANYINGLESFKTIHVENKFCYNHIGALFIDIVLQAGLNYNKVVLPRVKKFLITYPEADTTQKFLELVQQFGLEHIVNWKHTLKINRLNRVLEFAISNEINTCADLKKFLINKNNQEEFLKVKGVGPKTIDYTLKLLNFDTIAVDRHIYSFVNLADITINYNYIETKRIVEYAADLLEISRSSIDYSIWLHMSSKQEIKDQSSQLELFSY